MRQRRRPRIARWIAALPIATALVGPALPALAQLTPERTYYGIDRSIPMVVERPEGALGELRIDLFRPNAMEASFSSSVVEGRVDLATLFPTLWTTSSPELLYAQLVAGESRIGAPVVLQPMTTPRVPSIRQIADERTGRPRLDRQGRPLTDIVFPTLTPSQRVYSGIRAYAEKHVLLETTQGEVRIRMRPDEAPNTVWNFLSLVDGGFYTDIAFHRVVPNFVAQAGDPTGQGNGGPGYLFDLEPSELPHDFGVISMARTSDPNTNGSQIFLCLTREATQSLDGKYAAFGEAVDGAQTIVALGNTQVRGQTPVEAPRIVRASLVDAQPFGTGPDPVTRPESNPSGER